MGSLIPRSISLQNGKEKNTARCPLHGSDNSAFMLQNLGNPPHLFLSMVKQLSYGLCPLLRWSRDCLHTSLKQEEALTYLYDGCMVVMYELGSV